MNILILSTVHDIEDPRIFYKQVLSIKKYYPNVNVVVPSKTKKVFYKNDVLIIPLPLPLNRIDRVLRLQLIALFKIIGSKYDLIHFHDPELIFLAFILKKIFKKKIIFDIHENIIDSIEIRDWIPELLKKSVQKLYKYVESILIKDFDVLLIAEKSYRSVYGDRAIEILNYPIKSGRNKNLLKNFHDKIKFVYGGNITVERGAWQVIKSFSEVIKKYPECELHLIGKFTPNSLKGKFEEFITSNKLESKVFIYGKIPISELYSVIEGCHLGYCLLKPVEHHKGKLPGKIFDYMLLGVPVIASDFDIYKEYIIDKDTGITVDYCDTQSAAESIIKLLDNRDYIKEMSDNCFRESSQNWTWETQEKKMIDIYNNLAK